MLGREEGREKQIRIRCSKETFSEWKQMCAHIDPDLTQEEVMQIVLSVYDSMPKAFEKKVPDDP